MFSAGINYNGYNSKAIFSKLLKLNYNLKKFRLDKNIQKKINNKARNKRNGKFGLNKGKRSRLYKK